MSNRRTFLAGLASLPVAALPAAALATTSPDAALIAIAAGVEVLARRHNAAVNLCCDLDSRATNLKPVRPVSPVTPAKFITDVALDADGAATVHQRRAPTYAAAMAADKQHTAELEAWKAETEAIRRRTGQHVADRLSRRLYRRLEAAVNDLTPMTPTTWEGVVAKARVGIALDPHFDGALNEWEYAFVTAALRDAVRLGGEA